jgi:hypothetical protein
MANDISKAVSANPIKNGTAIVTCNELGDTQLLNTYVNNTPTIGDIEDKYDNRFYNGIFVQLVGNQTVIGG